MIKKDEIAFMEKVLAWDGRIPVDSWETLSKRHYYLLNKWTEKGWWDYGVSMRSGRLEQNGIIEMAQIVNNQK